MTYKTLLSIYTMEDSLDTLLPASRMALELEAHLDVVVLNQADIRPTLLYASETPGIQQEAFAGLLEQTDERVEQVHDYLRTEGVRCTVVPACQQLGLVADTVANAAVYTDLVLTHGHGTPLAGLAGQALEGAMLQAGRPVLMTPQPTDVLPVDPVLTLIAWDASPQAMHAVQAALPLLERSSEIRVVMLEESRRKYEAHSKRVDEWMNRHGIDVRVERIECGGAAPSKALHDHMRSASADLLVMGAYGHGRLRERMLGGVTHVMVGDLPCATLLAR